MEKNRKVQFLVCKLAPNLHLTCTNLSTGGGVTVRHRTAIAIEPGTSSLTQPPSIVHEDEQELQKTEKMLRDEKTELTLEKKLQHDKTSEETLLVNERTEIHEEETTPPHQMQSQALSIAPQAPVSPEKGSSSSTGTGTLVAVCLSVAIGIVLFQTQGSNGVAGYATIPSNEPPSL